MARIFNCSHFSKGGSESTLSENAGSLSLSSEEAPKKGNCEEKRKWIDKRVARFLASCVGNSSSCPDAEASGDTGGREVTPGALDVWLELPDEIKYDPALDTFKQLYEKQRGPRSVDEAKTDGVDDIIVVHPSDGRMTEQKSTGSRRLFERKEIQEHAADAFDSKQQKQDVFQEEEPTKPNGSSMPTPPVADQEEKQPRTKLMNILYYVKMTVLVLIWISFTTALLIWSEKNEVTLHTYVIPMETKNYIIKETRPDLRIRLTLTGPFPPAVTEAVNASSGPSERHLDVWLERWSVPLNKSTLAANYESVKQSSDVITLELLPDDSIDFAIASTRTQVLDLPALVNESDYRDELRNSDSSEVFVIRMRSNSSQIISLAASYSEFVLEVTDGVVYALVILIVLYTLIIFEIVNRMFAALITSTMGIAVLAAIGERPSMEEIVSWIDVETLLLLFSMMLLVAILAETGVFDYLAVLAFKLTNGRVWPLILSLCLTTALISTFLDNVTTVLLMTPVTIRLCEVMELNPVPVLMATVIYSNVGGTATPVGDPPNVIIVSNRAVINAGVDFTEFTLHMSAGILLVGVQTFLQLRWSYRNINKLRHSVPPEIQCLKQEIAVWRRAAASLASYSADEALVRAALERHATRLQRRLRRKKLTPPPPIPQDSYAHTLREMEQKYPIRDKVLLIKATIALSFVVIVFFLHSLPELKRLSLGWTALLGAILLLILADRDDLEPIIARVEWSTLLFFAALFILMEALLKLGLIRFIGTLTENMIMHVDVNYRLMVAILLLLWVSAIVSAFVDNIPLTTMMVRVASSLGSNPTLNLPFKPLIWAVAFGACLGGNGTLIGASANVVCAGVAEQHGYRFTFLEFFKFGFPIMIGHIVVISFYLIFFHCVFEWH